MEEFLHEKETANALSLKQQNLGKLRREGKVPYYRIGKSVLYKLSDFEMFKRGVKVPEPEGDKIKLTPKQ